MEGADISYDRWGNAADETPKGQPDRVTGRRRVVFLIRDPSKTADDPNAWEAASIGNDVNTCAVWIEGDSAFAVRPWETPEPGIVRPHMTETALKTEVVRLAKLQQRLRLAAIEPDAKRRAVLVVPFIEEQNYLARSEALSVLKECGDPAWPVVKPLILDESKLPIHNKLIHLLDKVGRKDAVPLIEAIIRQEMEYWDTLSKEKQQAGSYNPPMHHHYYKLCACLFVLKRTSYRDPEGIVANLYAKWDAHPILRHMGGGGPTSRSPVLEYADEILRSK